MVKLTQTQLTDILAESWTMRDICARLVLAQGSRYLDEIDGVLHRTEKALIRAQVERIVWENGTNKIAAIKAVRDKLPAHDVTPVFNLDWNYDGTDGKLGLADCKRLVEHVAHSLGKPY